MSEATIGEAPAGADAYREIVVDTFLRQAVRSAILIDDRFPTFEELLQDSGDVQMRFAEAPLAKSLYRMLKGHNVLCDVENRAGRIGELDVVERIRKSDLVILDYHLSATDDDPSTALDLLSKLAASPHFNIVALYTAAHNLDSVWFEVAAALRGGKPLDQVLSPDLLETWDALTDSPPRWEATIPISFFRDFLHMGNRAFATADAVEMKTRIEALGVEKKASHLLLQATLEHACRRLAKSVGEDAGPYIVRGDFGKGGARWVQSRNLFVAVIGKVKGPGGDELLPGRVWDEIEAALVAWEPNILQIILSEIQNSLGREGMAIDEGYLGDLERQHGLLYYLFSKLPSRLVSGDPVEIHPAIEVLVTKLTESLQSKLATEPTVLARTAGLLAPHLGTAKWQELPEDREQRPLHLAEFISELVPAYKSPKPEEVFFDLNSFLSTERFRGTHITTGTVFTDGADRWWVCSTPACDMIPREPSASQQWKREIFPCRATLALRLTRLTNCLSALNQATHGRRLYIRLHTGERVQLVALDENNHPGWEILFLADAGRISADNTMPGTFLFRGQIVARGEVADPPDLANPASCRLESSDFTIAGQLRREYASRLLQTTGNYLSRIGVDYISLPGQVLKDECCIPGGEN